MYTYWQGINAVLLNKEEITLPYIFVVAMTRKQPSFRTTIILRWEHAKHVIYESSSPPRADVATHVLGSVGASPGPSSVELCSSTFLKLPFFSLPH
jgi:hypothetical protein